MSTSSPLPLVVGAAALAIGLSPTLVTQPLHAHESCEVSRSLEQCPGHDHPHDEYHVDFPTTNDRAVELTGAEVTAMTGELGVAGDLQFS